MSSPPILDVAIIGLRHLHPRSYMPLLAAEPLTRASAVVEADETLRSAFCEDFDLPGYATVADMLAAHKPQCAILFLPHADCPDAAEVLASAGVHLMVEKPMAADSAGAHRIVEAAADGNVKLTTGYAWRFHPVAVEIKRLVDSGVLGAVVGGEGRIAAGRLQRYIDGHSPWMLEKARSGGGPMYNLGVHWIDLFCWVLSDNVTELTGDNIKINTQYDIEDNSMAIMHMSRGPLISLNISYTVPDSFPHGRDLYFAIRGTLGVISWSPAYEGEQDILFICSDHPDFGDSPKEIPFALEAVEGYSGCMGRDYLRDFAEAVIHDREPAISGADGVEVLKIVEAIYRSAESRRRIAGRVTSR